MIESSDILHILLQAEKYVSLAEQMQNRAIEVARILNETISDVDRLRRNAIFIGKTQSDFVSLASSIIEMDQLRNQLEALKARLSAYSAASCSYIATLYRQVSHSSEVIPLARMGNVIKRLTSVLKAVKELNIQYESTLANAVMMDTIITLQQRTTKSLQIIYFGRQVRSLIAVLS